MLKKGAEAKTTGIEVSDDPACTTYEIGERDGPLICFKEHPEKTSDRTGEDVRSHTVHHEGKVTVGITVTKRGKNATKH